MWGVLSKDDVGLFSFEIDDCDVTCPRIGKVNQIEGFACLLSGADISERV
jgi:hypothetical protein